MGWQIYVVIFLINVIIFNQFYKVATNHMKDAGRLTVLLMFICGLVSLSMTPFFEWKTPNNFIVYIILIIPIIIWAVYDRLTTEVKDGLEVSVVNILDQFSTIFLMVLGFVFLREEFTWNKLIGTFLIITSNIMIFYYKGKLHFNKFVLLGLLANLILAIGTIIDIKLSVEFNLPVYQFLTFFLPAMLIMIKEKIKVSDLKSEFKYGNKKAILLTGVSWGIVAFCQIRAYQLGDVTIITPLLSLSVILNVIFAYVFLKEKDSLVKKIIASIVILISVILINS